MPRKENQSNKPEPDPETETATETEAVKQSEKGEEENVEADTESQAISPELNLFSELVIIVLCCVTLAECVAPWL